MTGLFDGLRAWIGSFFGDGTDGDDASPEDEERFAGESPTVVHRDDRPLETPPDLDPSPPSEGGASPGTAPNAATTEDGGDTSDAGGAVEHPDRVSIPDAESVAGGTEAPAAGERAADGADADPSGEHEARDDEVRDDEVRNDEARDGEARNDEARDGEARNDEARDDEARNDEARDDEAGDDETADTADDVVCTVCGTAVEDPTGACPLCGSTDVRSAEAGDGPPGSPQGRTTVSAADDEAVDRLGDVRSGEASDDG